MSIKKIAVLFSGRGSNLLNILQKLHNKSFNGITIEVSLVITNRIDAKGIEYAREFNIEPVVIEHKNFSSREEFDKALVKEIKKQDISLVVLAGFMRILTPIFTNSVKAINLHPSILPLFKGANAIEQSFASGMKIGGVSVHFVSDELDGGEIIAQQCFQKNSMNIDEFEEKIHEIERDILVNSIIKLLC